MNAFKTVYFRNAAGEVREVLLPELDAGRAASGHPHEWSLDGKFADPPEGFVFSESDGGGFRRVVNDVPAADEEPDEHIAISTP
jgi:hypothetical protein